MNPLLELLAGRGHTDSLTLRAALALLRGMGNLYGGWMQQRARLYQRQRFASYQAPCPVISVGNLSVGGTGKTPMVLWLARHLTQQLAQPLAIVSRGYGTPPTTQAGLPAGITLVADGRGLRLRPPQAADEAALLAHHLPQTAILTGSRRDRLIDYACRQLGCRLILMDDGFQHLRVRRDLDLVLLDARHPFGNGALLPGGILREAPRALQRADAIVFTRCPDEACYRQARQLLLPWLADKPLYWTDHRPSAWQAAGDNSTYPLDTLRHTPVLAFCGIARPDSFAHLLQESGCKTLSLRSFPDHFPFNRQTLLDLQAQAARMQALAMVCTEKDAVKIDPAWLDAAGLPLFALRMALHWPQQPEWLLQRVAALAAQATPRDAAPHPPA
ncbi:MAG: tetraacyldisaccharide 4'-kinase [Magnetococcales bacterium]|nr:tetraacyldisaccharide 4'-kinase [Magnetococcales bacterium]